MKKILIIGCAAAGKTTLAKKLSHHLNLPHIQLDYLYWKTGWVDGGLGEFVEKMYKKIDEPAWIMDGTYVRALMPRAMKAELIKKVLPEVQIVTLRSPREVDRLMQAFLTQLNA